MVAACAALAFRRLAALPVPDNTPSDPPSTTAATGDDREAGEANAGRGELWVLCLAGTAAALVAAAELIFLRDIFETRMNTVFKLYYQAWLLLGIAVGPILTWLLPAVRARLAALLAAPRLQPAIEASTAPVSGLLALEGAGGAAFAGNILSSPVADVPARFAFATRSENAADTARSASEEMGETGEIGDVKRGADSPRRGAVEVPPVLRWLGVGGILLWMGILLVLVGASLVYPVLAASARTDNFTLARTLDGTAYMATDPVSQPAACNYVGAGSNHGDDTAIAWLNAHVTGDPVIVEAPGCEWTHYSRVSAFTGLPTLIGWPGGHEGEWRVNWLQRNFSGLDIYTQRTEAVNAIYTSPDEATVMSVLRQYNVRYVYVGAAERNLYPTANLDRLGGFLKVVYQHDGVTIYAVP